MTITAIVDRIEPRRVPSKRSDGTLRYMSKLAAHLMVDLERNRLLDGVGLSSSSWSSLSECKKKPPRRSFLRWRCPRQPLRVWVPLSIPLWVSLCVCLSVRQKVKDSRDLNIQRPPTPPFRILVSILMTSCENSGEKYILGTAQTSHQVT